MACQCFHRPPRGGLSPFHVGGQQIACWLLINIRYRHCSCDSSLMAFKGSYSSGGQFVVIPRTAVEEKFAIAR